MNRRNFFNKLGLGVVATLLAPKVLAQDKPKYIAGCDPIGGDSKGGSMLVAKHEGEYSLTMDDWTPPAIGNGELRIKRNGAYVLGDVFKSYNKTWIAYRYDGKYYYCLEQ